MESTSRENENDMKSFIDMPEWYKHVETIYMPMIDNNLNEMMAQLYETYPDLPDLHCTEIIMMATQYIGIRNEGIELAIQRYGLQMAAIDGNESEDEDTQPSTSRRKSDSYERPSKKQKTEESPRNALLSAIKAAFIDKANSTLHMR